jgi:hypothetical protein
MTTTPDLGPRLRLRLGPDATEDLSDAFEEVQNDMLRITTERFEGRLVAVSAELQAELFRTQCQLRQEMAVGDAALRVTLLDGLANIRTEMAGLRADVLRWSFLFWVGQVGAIAAMLAWLVRAR